MDARERRLAEAAARLREEDFQYLERHGIVDRNRGESRAGIVTRTDKVGKKRERRRIRHEWPDAGTVLEADYFGRHYEAEVISHPRFRTGKALKILNGPAAGTICRSFSGAMLKATESQRQEQGLGKSGVTNGWTFWRVKRIS